MPISHKGAERRKARVRKAIRARAYGRPRLSVHRSDKNIYAQIIDDASGRTLAAASTLDKDVKGSVKNGGSQDAASAVGKLIAERGKAAKVEEVIFDRGGYLYHGRVKALADAAREAGLKF
ncbi:MAG: 50S ribosomal protein L18 [Devosia sp. 67-54]|uniref:50S ribosomal protein L18 n=1 Tax=unclassified Devosia TaxID=196773 RepID=UPI00086B2EFD|nr:MULTISPECIES: 50S ribosomal protein L18 [unclassified Devosia]MBN9306211.1 50S ribosomal protein L18 [Devosia sp.]ODU62268.1 MAG: 50S ribosomal protein L18 [Pelagibacterium sp. SCN 68-10]OJX18287.1 MAG: 50S ribosomal protein L18 [Devosia sp. 67-54]